jgi:sensor histidine kinase regulating citrate/malate metabolism
MSLRVWQLAAFAYVLVLMLVALEVPLALNLSKRVDAEVRAQAADQARVVATSAAGRLDDAAALAPLVRAASNAAGGRVIVVGSTGRLLADSAGSAPGASYATRPEIRTALSGRTAQGERHSASLGEDILFTALPIAQRGQREGAVRVTQSLNAVHAEVRKDILALVGLGLAALALGLVVAWVLAGFLSRPLHGLTAAARRV